MDPKVSPPLPCTALVMDLRGFTMELNETDDADGSRAAFCAFLAAMNNAVGTCSRQAVHPHLREETEQWTHIATTGDGALLVFLHPEHHVRHGAIAALLLRRAMDRATTAYPSCSADRLDFGIGVEAGHVRRIGGELPTVIGRCINLAARIQDLNKTINRTRVVYGPSVVQALMEELHYATTARLLSHTEAASISDDEYLDNEARRNRVNRQLCVKFLHEHKVRGFREPRALFRLSRSSAELGNPRFDQLLHDLVEGDAGWLDEVCASLS